MIRKYQRTECVLCDEVHELHVHAYLERKVRSPDDGENHAIGILSIICAEAKAHQGRQYTKRLMPEFVIPECNIRLDRVLVLEEEEDPEASGSEDWSCSILGCVDGRTVGRHREWIARIVTETLKVGSEVLVQLPSFGVLPEPQIGQSEYGQLRRVLAALHLAAVRMYGQRREPPVIRCVQGVYWWVRGRKKLRSPLDRVVSATGFFDTN